MIRAAALAAVVAALVGTAPARARDVTILPSACTRAIAATEEARGLPSGLLLAIGFNEAGRGIEGGSTIWPWTVNVEGRGSYFDSAAEAIAFVRAQQAEGRRSIDVGCMQVNLHWHPDAFPDLAVAFDPQANAAYAATYLQQLHDAATEPDPGAWSSAVGRYHSAQPERGRRYRNQVVGYWEMVRGPTVLASLRQDVVPVPSRDPPPTPVRADDPFGLQLVAYWATPYGLFVGPEDKMLPPFDLEVRPPLTSAPAVAAAEPAVATAKPRRAPKRFAPLPPPLAIEARPAARLGLMARESLRSGVPAKGAATRR